MDQEAVSAATLQAITAQLAATRALLQRPPAGQRPRPVVITTAAPAPQAAASQGPVWMIAPEQIHVDAHRFQFRLSSGVDGTSGRLEGCPEYRLELSGSLLVWFDPADGSGPWLIDGHHRRALALADGAPLVPVLAVEAATAEEARAIGAMSNVSAGAASPQDLCRLLRDQELDPKTLARRFGLQRNSRIVADARTLLALDGGLFTLCATGELDLEQALALAAAADHALQRRLYAMALQRGWSAPQTLEAANLAQLAPQQAQVPAGTIPGLEALMSESNPLLDEQLLVRATIRRLLRCENRAVRTVAHHRAAAALERRGVAAIDTQAAHEVKAESGLLLARFGVLAGHSGPLAELIAQLAQQVADGADVGRLVDQEMAEIRRVLSDHLS